MLAKGRQQRMETVKVEEKPFPGRKEVLIKLNLRILLLIPVQIWGKKKKPQPTKQTKTHHFKNENN